MERIGFYICRPIVVVSLYCIIYCNMYRIVFMCTLGIDCVLNTLAIYNLVPSCFVYHIKMFSNVFIILCVTLYLRQSPGLRAGVPQHTCPL